MGRHVRVQLYRLRDAVDAHRPVTGGDAGRIDGEVIVGHTTVSRAELNVEDRRLIKDFLDGRFGQHRITNGIGYRGNRVVGVVLRKFIVPITFLCHRISDE
jgi:hypothetical protein